MIGGSSKTSTWIYVYDGDNIALEIYTAPDGTKEKTVYTHGQGVDEHLALERNGQNYYYHADGLESVTTITDSNRNVVQSYSYDSFGRTTAATGFRNDFAYTGREWDKETGLYYYRARYYDPMEGRFIGKDPIGFRGGINLYSYAGQNPINRKDPHGKDWYSDNETTKGTVDAIVGALLPDAGPAAIGSVVSSPEAFTTFASIQIKNFNLGIAEKGLHKFDGPSVGSNSSCCCFRNDGVY